jgi:hypothetical protein
VTASSERSAAESVWPAGVEVGQEALQRGPAAWAFPATCWVSEPVDKRLTVNILTN